MRAFAASSALALALALPACGGGEQRAVYVPAQAFAEELFVITSRGVDVRVGVGETLVLHAQRRSGPWRPILEEDLEPGQCSADAQPPELEAEVAASVTWVVEPEGHATFNVEPRDDGSRDVRFDAPGVYRMTAESSSLCGEPFTGDTLRIEVVE